MQPTRDRQVDLPRRWPTFDTVIRRKVVIQRPGDQNRARAIINIRLSKDPRSSAITRAARSSIHDETTAKASSHSRFNFWSGGGEGRKKNTRVFRAFRSCRWLANANFKSHPPIPPAPPTAKDRRTAENRRIRDPRMENFWQRHAAAFSRRATGD